MNRRVVHMKNVFLEPNAWEATLTGVAHKKTTLTILGINASICDEVVQNFLEVMVLPV